MRLGTKNMSHGIKIKKEKVDNMTSEMTYLELIDLLKAE